MNKDSKAKKPSARTRDILVTIQRSDDDGTIGKLLTVLGVRGEETLE
jgi:hypothetical protein